ncbi:hypothetical protein [Cytobacillus oceanisediminis]|uniref:hypothetical protein n=1 Tax=Cytobacillus oceanisediminis TaxID=665099 RepID=UPI001FB1CE44|nr:hypothetical protein [Cytobacillus oceanisediminis]UOE58054.1 hypothetical protein IRB79_27715 [Cytobacillus oceanisediminis]
MKPTYIERHHSLHITEFEGLWEMTFMNPFNREEPVSIYIIGPNSYVDNQILKKDRPVVEAGPRLSEIMKHLLYRIERYPYSWDLSGKKLVSYGYDFETDFNGNAISALDLTEIAHKEVKEYFNFFSPLDVQPAEDEEKVSGKGVMAKLKITLDRPKSVNHLTVDFFTEYPIELLTLMYQSEQSGTIYEIPLSKVMQTNHSATIHFPSVFAKTFFIIIKQESYTLIDQSTSEEQAMNAELWNQASLASRSMYETSVNDYFNELMTTQAGIKLHQEIIASYQNINKPNRVSDEQGMNRYGEDFEAIKTKLDSEQR